MKKGLVAFSMQKLVVPLEFNFWKVLCLGKKQF
jgi:hypothetical protein